MTIDKSVIRTRLLARIQRDPNTKCWIYLGFWTDQGEARMRVGDKVYSIQRVSAWLFRDLELWEPGYAYRICQSPACCNPRHVRVAETFQDALADMRQRGLFTHRGHRKLSDRQRACIRVQLEFGISALEIAVDQKLNPTTVRRCLHAARPGHVGDQRSPRLR